MSPLQTLSPLRSFTLRQQIALLATLPAATFVCGQVIVAGGLLWPGIVLATAGMAGMILTGAWALRSARSETDRSHALLFESNPHPMWVYDAQTLQIVAVNRAAVRHYDYSEAAFLSMTHADLAHESGDGKHLTAYGTTIDVQVTESEVMHEGRASKLVSILDLTERYVADEVIGHLTRYDALTGLPNRQQLLVHADEALVAARVEGSGSAMLLLDIDRFRAINDSFGRATGDELLKVVAGALQDRARRGDVIARDGNDQFFILMPRIESQSEAHAMAERLLATFEERFRVAGRELFAAASIGVACFPNVARSADELLAQAEAALYAAKQDGGGKYALYGPEMLERARSRRGLEDAFRRAIEDEEFTLHYQPQIELTSGKIVGMEALVRWEHPVQGLIAPADFIPLAEETGHIVALGEWVLREACRQYVQWLAAGMQPIRLGVNLSPRQLLDPKLPGVVAEILRETGMPPAYLELEVTEGSFVRNAAAALTIFEALQALGTSLSIDDFGTGYSSLSYLKQFPFNTLKIDRAFMTTIDSDDFDQALVQSITTVAHNRLIRVIAEGVETREQLAMVRTIGCEEVQGFYFSRPLSSSAFFEFTRAWQSGAKGSAA